MKRILQLLLLSVLLAIISLGGAGCSKKAKMARAYEKGDKFFASGDYDNAEKEYINVLKIDRLSPRAYAQLGIMSLEDGRAARAGFFLNRAIAMDSNNVDLHLKLATLLLSASLFKEARVQALYVLDKRSEDPDAPLLLADSAMTLNDDDFARQTLKKLVVTPAKRAPVQVALGSIAFREHDYKSADAAFESARVADPKFGPLYIWLGNYYMAQKDAKHAEEAYKFAAESAPIRSPRRIKYVQFKLETGDVEGAKHILQDMTQKAPDFLPGWLALAEMADREKKYDEANQLINKVLARDPENFDALLFSAHLGMLQSDPSKAVAQLEKLAKGYTNSPTVRYQLGVAYNAAGDTTKAMASLREALALNPNYFDAQLVVAQIKLARGDASGAIVSLKELSQLHATITPTQLAQAEFSLGEAYRQAGDLENSAAVYRQLEEALPKSPLVSTLRGNVFSQMGRKEDARKEYERSLQIAPGDLTAVSQLIDLDISEGQFAKALARAQAIFQLDTNSTEPSLLIAKISIAQHKDQEAAAILQKAIDAHPDFKAGYLSLGNLYSDMGEPKKAVEVGNKLLAKYPDDPAGLMLVATALDAAKDIKGAEEAYEKELKGSPKNSVALNNLAYLYAEHGQAEKGLEFARRARELLPQDPFAGDTLGWVLYRKGDYAQAEVVLQESIAKIPSMPDVQYHLGMSRYMQSEEDLARTALQYSLKLNQPFVGKDEAALALSILAIDPRTATPDQRAILEKRIADQPGDGLAQSRLGAIYKRDGNADKAITAYEAALKSNPRNLKALVDLAQIYSARPKEIDKAYGYAKDASKLAGDDPNVERMTGWLAFQAGDYKFALSLLQDVTKKQAADAELMFEVAQAQYSAGRIADATAGARNALQTNPGFPRAAEAKQFLDLITLENNPGQAVTAATQVEQALKNDPNSVPALMVSGVIAEQKPDASTARETFEKVLAKYPDFLPAARHLAIIYGATPVDDKRGLALAQTAYQSYPADADVIKALGIISYRVGDYSSAARYLKESDSKKNGDAQLMYYLGMAQYQLKSKADSKKSLTRSLELKLPEPMAADAKKVLAELK